jgi:DNA-binding NarL/FixJ family response regulator
MARSGNTRVLIVDDQPVFSIGLSSLIEGLNKFTVVGTATNIADAIRIAEKTNPHLVITEINLGSENGMDMIKKLKSMNHEIIILILSMRNERFYSERLLRLGVRGYIMKNAPAGEITEAVSTVLNGKIYLSENERERIFQAMTEESSRRTKDWTVSVHKLSNRELQVFSLIGKGYGTIEIASMYNLSNKTIDTHKEHLKLKLHCSSSQELRQMAVEWSNNSGDR